MSSSLENHPFLSSVKADLAAFRSSHSKNRPFPTSIKQRVLKAIDEGTPSREVAKFLNLTQGQIAGWRRRAMPPQKSKPSEPRTLDVVPSVNGAHGLRISYECGRLVLELSFSEGR